MADPQNEPKNDDESTTPAKSTAQDKNGQSTDESAAAEKKEDPIKSNLKVAAEKTPDEEAKQRLEQLLSTVGDAGLAEVTLPPVKSKNRKKTKEKKDMSSESSRSEAGKIHSRESEAQAPNLYPDGPPAPQQPLLKQWKELERPESQSDPNKTAPSQQPPRGHARSHRGRQLRSRRQNYQLAESAEAPAPSAQKEPEGKIMASRMLAAGLDLPADLSLEMIESIQIPLPEESENENAKSETLFEFARSSGLSGADLNSYFQIAFLKSKEKRLAQEALNGLKDEALSQNNPQALPLLQELLSNKTLVELFEAELLSDKQSVLKALTQLAALADVSESAYQALENHPLAEEARAAADKQSESTLERAQKAYESFLSRELDKVSAEQRKARRSNAVKRIEAAAEHTLKYSSNPKLGLLAHKLKSLDILLSIKESENPAEAASLIAGLKKLQETNKNASAGAYIGELEANLSDNSAGTLSRLEDELLNEDSELSALDKLQAALPDLQSILNEMRVELLVNNLSRQSSWQAFKETSRLLEEERKHGNLLAHEYLNWTRTGESSQKMSELVSARRLDDLDSVRAAAETIKSEMDRLSRLLKAGSDAARVCLLGVIMSITDSEQQEDWLYSQGQTALVPDLEKLSQTEHSILAEYAALSINDALSNNPNANPLSFADAIGLAVALSQSYASADRNVQKAIEALFSTALAGKDKETVIEALMQAEKAEVPGSAGLSELILRECGDNLTSDQLESLGSLSRHNLEAGIRTLAGIARGAVDLRQAENAIADLRSAAASSSKRDEIIAILADELMNKGDQAFLLLALAELAGMDSPCNYLVLELLRNRFQELSSSQDLFSYTCAARALVALCADWDEQEVELIIKNLSPLMLELIERSKDCLSPASRQFFLKKQQEFLLKGTAAQRISALETLSAFSQYLSEDMLEDIAFFASESGHNELLRQGLSDDLLSRYQVLRESSLKACLESGKLSENDDDCNNKELPRELISSLKQDFPEINSKTLCDYLSCANLLLENWHQDLNLKNMRLLQIEHELVDLEFELESSREELKSQAALFEEAAAHAESSPDKNNFEKQESLEKNFRDYLTKQKSDPQSKIGKLLLAQEKLTKEHDLLAEQISTVLENRASDLQSVLDYMYEQYDWPELSIDTRENKPSLAGYQFGTATIFIPCEQLLSARESSHFVAFLLKSIVNAMQDASLAQYSMHKGGGNLQHAYAFYEEICGVAPEAALINESSQFKRASKNFSGLSEKRLLELAEDIKKRDSYLQQNSEELYLQAKFLEGRLYCLSRDKQEKSLELFLGQLSQSQEFARRSFPRAWPEKMDAILEKWTYSQENKTRFKRIEAMSEVLTCLTKALSQINEEHQKLHGLENDRIERESASISSDYFCRTLLAAGAAHTASAVTPFEAVRELNLAASQEGDSLHINSQGWEARREMFEHKLKSGFMSTKQLKHLFALPKTERAKIEHMLIKNRLSAQAFSSMLKLDALTLQHLFQLAPSVWKRAVLPVFERGLNYGELFKEICSQKEPLRSLTMGLIEKTNADPNRTFSKIHLERLLHLPEAARIEFCQLAAASTGTLSLLAATEALSIPTRTVAGKEVNDTLCLARSVHKGIMSAQQIRDFARLDEEARSGLTALLSVDALNRESCHAIFQKLENGELNGANVRELGMAKLFSKLPDGFVEHLLKQDTALRNALFERLASQSLTSSKTEAPPVLPELVRRMEPLNELRKQGVINEALMRLLSTPHESDLLIMDLLKDQSEKAAALRLGSESIFQLAIFVRTRKIDVFTLEAYRAAIEEGIFDRQSLRMHLAQKQELREAAEKLMIANPEAFQKSLKTRNYTEMLNLAREIGNPAKNVFADLFDSKTQNFAFNMTDKFRSCLSLKMGLGEFMNHMRKADFRAAFRYVDIRLKSRPAAYKTSIYWHPRPIDLLEMQNEESLQNLLAFMQCQCSPELANQYAQGDITVLEEPINAADPVIRLASGREFRLRDPSMIFENGEWRESDPQEKDLMETIRNSPPGKAIIAKLGSLLMDEWAIRHAISGLASELSLEDFEEIESGQEISEEDEFVTGESISVASLFPGTFQGIREGRSNIEFPNGMRAQMSMSPSTFRRLERAYNRYLEKLKIASKLEEPDKRNAMFGLVKLFDSKYAGLIQDAGVRVNTSNQSYLKLLYDITLETRYTPPGNPRQSSPINLNLQQGLRRLLAEHPHGKQLYRELSSIKYSGITPKFDPSPPSGRPAMINPADQRKLTLQQRSAMASAIFSDNTAVLRGTFRLAESGAINASADLSVLRCESDETDPILAAYSRAEEWSHLMSVLNDYKPLSRGGAAVAVLYERGKLSYIRTPRETLILKNDFLQLLRELDIEPDGSLFETAAYYRRELDDLLAKLKPETIVPELTIQEKTDEIDEEPKEETSSELNFSPGQAVTYNAEPYKVISVDEESKQVFIQYEGEARDPAPVMARYTSDHELASKFKAVQSGNDVHYRSMNSKHRTIYVLSTDDKGQKVLHNDWRLRFVLAEDLLRAEETETTHKLAKLWNSNDLAVFVRKLFDNSSDYALLVEDRVVSLEFTQEVLGSAADVDIQIKSSNGLVSPRHLQILKNADGVFLQDLHSKTGTFFNWRKLAAYETVKLSSRDKIALGDIDGPSIRLIFQPKAPETICMVGDKILIPGSSLTVGRLHSADAFVSDQSVSKIQATVRMAADGKIYVKDGGVQGPSNTGLLVNNQAVIPGTEIELSSGDKVTSKTGIKLPVECRKAEKTRPWKDKAVLSSKFNLQTFQGLLLLFSVHEEHGPFAICAWSPEDWRKPARRSFKQENCRFNVKDSSKQPARKRAAESVTNRARMSKKAIEQSNRFLEEAELSEKLLNGFAYAGAAAPFDEDGNFQSAVRCATIIDRRKDRILEGVIADARRRYGQLEAEQKARVLTEHVRDLLSSKHLSPEQLDQWYDQFAFEHRSKHVYLGEFIKEGKGVCIQQALLLKLLADEFGDLRCRIVRGMKSSHIWTVFELQGQAIIHDPRAHFFSPLFGEEGALSQAKYWLPDAEYNKQKNPEFKIGDSVSFDGTGSWKVIAYDNEQDEVLISTDGIRSINSADLCTANQGKTLMIGASYLVPEDSGSNTDSSQESPHPNWTLESINKDGSLRLVKHGAIQVLVPSRFVYPRSQR